MSRQRLLKAEVCVLLLLLCALRAAVQGEARQRLRSEPVGTQRSGSRDGACGNPPQGEQGRGLCEPSTEGAGTGRELGRWEKHVYRPRQHFHCCEVLREPPLCEHLSLPIC